MGRKREGATGSRRRPKNSFLGNRPFPSHNVRCAERSRAKGAEKLGFAPDQVKGKGVGFKGKHPLSAVQQLEER